jgi:hypothetical protein
VAFPKRSKSLEALPAHFLSCQERRKERSQVDLIPAFSWKEKGFALDPIVVKKMAGRGRQISATCCHRRWANVKRAGVGESRIGRLRRGVLKKSSPLLGESKRGVSRVRATMK